MDINNKKEIAEIRDRMGALYRERPRFRIWSPKSKRMIYSQDISILNLKQKSATLTTGEVVKLDDANWMTSVSQVGLEQQLEVYQGDILRVTSLSTTEQPNIFYVRVGKLSCGGVMTCPPFGENGDPTFLENEADGGIFTSDLDQFDVEIAGNIFEMDDSAMRQVLRCEKKWQRIQDGQWAKVCQDEEDEEDEEEGEE